MYLQEQETDTLIAKQSAASIKDTVKHCTQYQGAETWKSFFQLSTTLALFFATCGAMVYLSQISYLATTLLMLPAAGLLIRIFIFQHDCGHGAFWNSKKANEWTGRALSVLTVTPYDFWRRSHNMHHATSGDLDRRSIGGIDTITAQEYRALPKGKQRAYRIYRNPLVLLIFGTPFFTIISQRFPLTSGAGFYEGYKTLAVSSVWKSVMLTNISLIIFYGSLAAIIGWSPLLTIFLPILIITAWIGGWLFYIQHQFEDAHWQRNENWNAQEAALHGSSYYVLHPILQWFTGNIGLHHIHHLCSRIPNYKLQECMDTMPELKNINRLTLRDSLDCLRFKLWDEEQNKMVPFSAI